MTSPGGANNSARSFVVGAEEALIIVKYDLPNRT